MPQGCRIYWLVKAENFLHAAVAIGRNDQVPPRQAWPAVRHVDNHVVMELALLMMRDQVVAAPATPDALKERAKHALRCKPSHDSFRCLRHRSIVAGFDGLTTMRDSRSDAVTHERRRFETEI